MIFLELYGGKANAVTSSFIKLYAGKELGDLMIVVNHAQAAGGERSSSYCVSQGNSI
jgi:hypothetical protein